LQNNGKKHRFSFLSQSYYPAQKLRAKKQEYDNVMPVDIVQADFTIFD